MTEHYWGTSQWHYDKAELAVQETKKDYERAKKAYERARERLAIIGPDPDHERAPARLAALTS